MHYNKPYIVKSLSLFRKKSSYLLYNIADMSHIVIFLWNLKVCLLKYGSFFQVASKSHQNNCFNQKNKTESRFGPRFNFSSLFETQTSLLKWLCLKNKTTKIVIYINCPALSAILILCYDDREVWRRFKLLLFFATQQFFIIELNGRHDFCLQHV